MNNLIIEPQKDKLGVKCNSETGIIEMKGTSYPDDAMEFFEPIFKWIEEYIADSAKPIVFNFWIKYLNSSSTKGLFDILDLLEEYSQNGGDVLVNWHCPTGDRDIEETGKEFMEDMEIPFEIIHF